MLGVRRPRVQYMELHADVVQPTGGEQDVDLRCLKRRARGLERPGESIQIGLNLLDMGPAMLRHLEQVRIAPDLQSLLAHLVEAFR